MKPLGYVFMVAAIALPIIGLVDCAKRRDLAERLQNTIAGTDHILTTEEATGFMNEIGQPESISQGEIFTIRAPLLSGIQGRIGGTGPFSTRAKFYIPPSTAEEYMRNHSPQ